MTAITATQPWPESKIASAQYWKMSERYEGGEGWKNLKNMNFWRALHGWDGICWCEFSLTGYSICCQPLTTSKQGNILYDQADFFKESLEMKDRHLFIPITRSQSMETVTNTHTQFL